METQEKMDARIKLYKAITPGPTAVEEKELYKARLAARLKAASTVALEKSAETIEKSAELPIPPVEKAMASEKKIAPSMQALELFGSFFLGEQEFALPANCIREVVNFPEKLIPIPLSPPYLEGMFTLRGAVIPVISLARLFRPDAECANAMQKIAIIDHKCAQIGLLFDSTGEIVRIQPEQRSILEYTERDAHGVVAGTIQLAGGARLLQILDASALIQIENVPQILQHKKELNKVEENRFHLQADRRQCVSFHIGNGSFAFDIKAIREIINVPEIKTSILDSPLCLGAINLRGTMIPIIDFCTLLKVEPSQKQDTYDQRILISRIGNTSFGFLLDSVDDIISFFPDDILTIPLLSKARAAMYHGCIVQKGKSEIILLDHEGIFSHNEIVAINKGIANLYPTEIAGDDKRAGATARAQRKVYITFTIANTFAVEIREIREIIDYPTDIIKPPGMPPFMRGVMNLRHQLISLIDCRSLYDMPPSDDAANTKVLIVEHGEERYGLIVDAVVNIVTIPDSNRYPVPKMMRLNAGHDLRSEMVDVVEMTTDNHDRQTVSVFQMDIFLQKLSQEWHDKKETGA